MMINLIALTMMCDANRMIILQWPGFVTFTWDGMIHTSDHHGLSHRNGSVAVGGTCAAGVIDNISQIDSWYAGKYSKLVHLINSIKEGGASMLDNSMVMWLPELADGNAHNNNNLPIVIAGSARRLSEAGRSRSTSTRRRWAPATARRAAPTATRRSASTPARTPATCRSTSCTSRC